MNPTFIARVGGLLGTVAFALFGVLAAPAAAQGDGNPWLTNRFLNMAHQGGELEAPSNTMYALKSAIAERGRTRSSSTSTPPATASWS